MNTKNLKQKRLSFKLHSFLENNSYYNILLVLFALVTGIESILEFSFEKKLLPLWFDNAVFIIFLIDLCSKLIIFFIEKIKKPSTKFSSLFSTLFVTIDFIALLPDVVALVFGLGQINLKALRVLRAFKLLRLTRVFSRNTKLINSILNFFRYKLRGQGLILVVNALALILFGGIFGFIHFEYQVFKELEVNIFSSLQWGFEIFTKPYGRSLDNANGSLLKVIVWAGSTLGLFVYASIIGVFSNVYTGLFKLLEKGEGMIL